MQNSGSNAHTSQTGSPSSSHVASHSALSESGDPNAMDFRRTRSSSLTKTRLRFTGVRGAPPPRSTGHDERVQKGDGCGSSGVSPR
eukprot:30920-Pelagococcus_subviridis.AAC.5